MRKRLGTLALGLILALGTTGALRSSSVKRGSALVPSTAAPAGCTTDLALCLQDGRFLVEATWTKSDGSSGVGHPVNLGVDSGYFWFLDPDNTELVVKALDGCSVNGHGWFFAGGLTNLEVAIVVTDTATGNVQRYANPQGVAFAPIADAGAFACPAGAASMFALDPEEPRDGAPAILAGPAVAARRGAASGCTQDDAVLCLDGRFQVEASWESASGSTGSAHAVSLGSESGYFWFFDESNVELVVKALDACAIQRGQWFFAAGLTTVGVQIKVTDTFTSEVRNYSNPLGSRFPPIQDTAAFSFCATPTPTPTSTPTFTPTPTPTQALHTGHAPTPTPPRTPPPTPTPVSYSAHVFISCPTLGGCGFSPSTVHIPVGGVVYWGLHGRHTTTSVGNWDSGRAWGYTHAFPLVGAFFYHCSVHPHETGTVFVDP